MECSVMGCSKKSHARGYCSVHYGKLRHHGDPLWNPPEKPTCQVAELYGPCGGKTWALGLCAVHYAMMRTRGTTVRVRRKRGTGTLKVQKTKRSLRPEGHSIENRGYILEIRRGHPNATKKGYVRQHVYVMSEMLGRGLMKGEQVHHRNGVMNDNRIENLELWSGQHPPGQRVSDLIAWAVEVLDRYHDQPTLWPDGVDPASWQPGQTLQRPASR